MGGRRDDAALRNDGSEYRSHEGNGASVRAKSGAGRPGWHMECSVMSTKYLGNHFDIHCGGVDNIFPHHENEIAQSCAALDTEFVNIWMHSEHLNMADEKMSKSLGNIKTIPELLDDGHSAESLRYSLISSHYRSKLAFSSNKLDDSRKAVHRINDLYNRLQGMINDGNSFPTEYDQFIEALVDDLNTPKALGILFNYLKGLNRKIENDKLNKENPIIPPELSRRMGQTGRHMERAEKSLQEQKIRESIESENQALEGLNDTLDMLNQIKNSNGKMGKAQRQIPRKLGTGNNPDSRRGGLVRMQKEHVLLPAEDQYQAPKEFREEILNAMKRQTPKDYQRMVMEYYKNLVK